MVIIPLQAIPKQEFTINLEGSFYDISIKLTVTVMSVSISRDGTRIVSNTRAVPGFPIIPYRYLEDGNFTFITANDEYPIYELFGINQFLIYASEQELEDFRAI